MRRSLLLPIIMCSISVPLLAWDFYNQKAIMAAGMAWDTGAPIWPYQTAEIFLVSLDTPAYAVTNLLLYRGFSINSDEPLRYLILILFIWLCWWIIGRHLDKPRKPIDEPKQNKSWATFLLLMAIALAFLGLNGIIDATNWWWRYSRQLWSSSNLLMLRSIGPSLWLLVMSWIALRAGRARYPANTPSR